MSVNTIIIMVTSVWLSCSVGSCLIYSSFYKLKGWPQFSSRPLSIIVGLCWAGPISLCMSIASRWLIDWESNS